MDDQPRRRGADLPQQRISSSVQQSFSYAYFGPLAVADRSAVIGYSAQSCTSGVFGSSCTPWETQTIVPLPYGPDTCAQGYVWRDAFAGDHICVTPASRNQAASDNAAAASRVDPQGAWGPNTCVNGYVWRVARPSDLVCVTPAVRDQTATENANPNAHRAGIGRASSQGRCGPRKVHGICEEYGDSARTPRPRP